MDKPLELNVVLQPHTEEAEQTMTSVDPSTQEEVGPHPDILLKVQRLSALVTKQQQRQR